MNALKLAISCSCVTLMSGCAAFALHPVNSKLEEAKRAPIEQSSEVNTIGLRPNGQSVEKINASLADELLDSLIADFNSGSPPLPSDANTLAPDNSQSIMLTKLRDFEDRINLSDPALTAIYFRLARLYDGRLTRSILWTRMPTESLKWYGLAAIHGHRSSKLNQVSILIEDFGRYSEASEIIERSLVGNAQLLDYSLRLVEKDSEYLSAGLVKKILQLSTKSDNADIAYNGARLLEKGVRSAEISPDSRSAIAIYERLAKSNHKGAMNRLGRYYVVEIKTKEAYQKARKLFEKSAELGSPLARAYLANLYYYGLGVPRNLSKTLSLYWDSALLGSNTAQTNLGAMYLTGGPGLQSNHLVAYALFDLASKNGSKEAGEYSSILYRSKKENERIEMESYLSEALKTPSPLEFIKRTVDPDNRIVASCSNC